MTLVLALSIPIALGLLTYLLQERGRRHAGLLERRRVLYESLIRSLVELLGANTSEERSRLLTRIETSWLFASDQVLDATYRYIEAYDKVCCSLMQEGRMGPHSVLAKVKADEAAREELRDRLAVVFAQMRHDIRQDTSITNEWARKHLDIYHWGILAGEETPRAGDWGAPDRPSERLVEPA